MSRPVRAAILGGTGYGAGELLRLLTQHPAAEVVAVTSTSQAGQPIADAHPHLRGFYEQVFEEAVDFERLLAAEHPVVISALPHGASGAALETLLRGAARQAGGERLRVIDLSGDFRLQTEDLHAAYYPHSAWLGERRKQFVYGLPELARDAIRAARAVANPGCLATAAILAAAPLARDGLVERLAIDAKTGSSGSGRQLKETTHHPTRHANFRAYKPLAHQHEPEIRQALGDPYGERLQTTFVAQRLDLTRGIYATVHAQLPEPVDTEALLQRYEEFYADCPFVRITADEPELQNVVGSNFCDIGVACRGRQSLIMAALDNLVKGMAGAAIQNLNLMCELPETMGLWSPAVRPA